MGRGETRNRRVRREEEKEKTTSEWGEEQTPVGKEEERTRGAL